MTRIFIDVNLCAGQHVALPPTAARHVVQVLRLRVGAPITLFNGRGGEYRCLIQTQNRREAVVSVGEFAAIERESPLDITLIQGLSRAERMDYSIQKAVELGVRRIVPLQAQRSTVRLTEERAQRRMQHWRGVITHACEQCGRNQIPTLERIHEIEEILNHDADAHIVMDPNGTDAVSSLRPETRSLQLVIGPEGGLDEAEISCLRGAGFHSLRLGPRTLRTETAAVAGLSILQARFGDLGGAPSA